jgi:predicted secreted protein
MGTFTGQDGTIVLKLSAAIIELKSFNITTDADIVDTTTMSSGASTAAGGNDGWRTKKAFHKSWTCSMDGLYDSTDVNGQGDLVPGAELAFAGYPSGLAAASDNVKLSGLAIIKTFDIKTSFDGMVEFSATIEGTGPLLTGIVA